MFILTFSAEENTQIRYMRSLVFWVVRQKFNPLENLSLYHNVSSAKHTGTHNGTVTKTEGASSVQGSTIPKSAGT